MSDEEKWSRRDVHRPVDDDYAVILPCKPDEFRDFLSGLLGKPQTIARIFHGVFEINAQDVETFYHLVEQRVQQQHDSTIIQFVVRIVFKDNSSVLLNSLDDFLHYHEIRPVASVAVHLSWTILIRFPNKNAPEKQVIDVSIVAEGRGPIFDEAPIMITPFREYTAGHIYIRIQHTARTWGADIEAMLSQHVENLLKAENKWKRFLAGNCEVLGVLAGLAFLLAVIFGGVLESNRFYKAQLATLPDAKSSVDQKLSYLLQLVAGGSWARFSVYFVVFVAVSFVLSIFLMVWIASQDIGSEPSFVLLSSQSLKYKEKMVRKYRNHWISFVSGFGAAVLASLVANILFFKMLGS